MTDRLFNVQGLQAISTLRRKLTELGERIKKERDVITNKTASKLANRAKKGIQKGTRSGRLYKFEVDLPGNPGDPAEHWTLFPRGKVLPIKKRWKPHRASAPGEFPKTDKGGLVSSIMWRSLPYGAEIGTDLDYGAYLESGTDDGILKPRPWLQPSIDAEMPYYVKSLKAMIVNEIAN